MEDRSPDVRSIFDRVVELNSLEERERFLTEMCSGAPEVREQVERLLRAHSAAGSFLQSPAANLLVTADQIPVDAPDTIIGPYKLLEKIGEGGFGVVFMAEQQQPLRRKVALKILKPGMDTRQVVARFDAERQALALMDHPNIAKVFDGGESDTGRPYFVMELVRGIPITDFCDQNRLGVRERLGLFAQVCRAVQHAHQKGVIHRDIKPTNVLVTLHDGAPVPKVIDFGIAKAVGQPLTEKTLYTNFAQMIGTPLYMSPEQAQFSGLDVDTRSDVYSLGVLLYELLTGTTPFDKERLRTAGFDEIRRIIREEEPAKPSTRMSTLGQGAATVSANRGSESRKLSALFRGELDWIVMKALEKDRNRRYETASAFAADVQRYLADEPVQASPPSAWYRVGKFLRRNRGPVLAASIVSLALFGGSIGAAYGAVEARKQREISSLLQQAEAARGEAVSARDGESKAKQETEDARDKLARVEYGRSIQVALQEWRENNIPAALSLLNRTRADLRGWEWRYVHRLCHSDLATLVGHTGAVWSADFSTDGTRIVTGGFDRTARVWNSTTGAALLALKGHTASVLTAAFSPDGSRVLTASMDRSARVWNAATGAEILNLRGHIDEVRSAAYSPDGSRIVTGSLDWTARVWNAKDGSLVITLKGHTEGIEKAVFSRDGSRILTSSYDKTAKVWDAATGAETLTLKGHADVVIGAAFSPDGTRVVTASYDGTAKVWNARSGELLLTLKDHKGIVWSAKFSPDGLLIATGSLDRTVRLWDAQSGAHVLTHNGHRGGVNDVSFSADGNRLVTGNWDSTAKVWETKKETEALSFKERFGGRSALFSPDGLRVVIGGGSAAKICSATTGTLILTLKGHTSNVWWASFSPDGTRVASASADNTAMVWDSTTGAALLTLRGHTSTVANVSFSPDGSRIVTASSDRTVRVWDARTGVAILTIKGHTRQVRSASFSPDGSRVVSASEDKTARVWDAATGIERLILKGHTDDIWSASFSQDGTRIVTASDDRTVRVWDAWTGVEMLTITGHHNRIVGASFNPDGSRIVTVSDDDTSKVWDARTGIEVLTLRGHAPGIYWASFSPDGSRLLTIGGGEAPIKVWDASPVQRP